MSLLTITTFLLVGCKKEESTKNEIVSNACNNFLSRGTWDISL